MAQEGFNTMQSYEPSPDLFSLQTGMEMMGFPQKGGVLEQHHQGRDQREATGGGAPWRTGFFPKHGGAVTIAATDPLAQYYEPQENLMAAGSNTTEWVQPPFQQPQMIPATPTRADHHQLNHGLSLSLFNPNPNSQQQQQQIVEVTEDGRFQLLGSQGLYHHQQQQQQVQLQMRCSKFLVPVQELLSEFCNLGSHSKKKMPQRSSQWEDGTGGGGPSSSSSSSWNQQSLQSLDILELQRRKAKLMLMLEEVDRRYRKYCDQMRGVVASFEAVAGEGSASVYSSLAARAMSRHFRCLRDGIVGHIRATKKAMGEKDGGGAMSAPGATKGETPRLKIVDQYIRQQKLFQQGGLMESHPWRPQRGLPERSVSILRAWLFEHFLHPYPSDVDKHILARQTGLSRSQVSNWFINARVRLWKPMVEEMYNEETKDQQQQENPSSSATTTIGLEGSTTTHHRDHHLIPTVSNPNPTHPFEDQKPDSDSLSSVIVNHHRVGRPGGFGVVDNIDFSSYSSSVGHQNHHQGFANNVSLTLGLQQHDGGGMNLSFSPAAAAQQGSVFFAREAMENCNQPVQFSILDGEGQSMALPYRNLMGAQLLHDLAG